MGDQDTQSIGGIIFVDTRVAEDENPLGPMDDTSSYFVLNENEDLQEELTAIVTTDPLNALLAIRNGYEYARWDTSSAIGKAVTLTYSFLQGVPQYYDSSDSVNVGKGFEPFSEAQKIAVRTILASISEMVNITFTEVEDVGQLTFGNHVFENTSHSDDAAYAYFPSTSEYGGDVWINTNSQSNQKLGQGEYGYETLIHEIGHALGLDHPHDAPNILSTELDNKNHTVMTYNNQGWLSPSTLMLFDIEALQYLYGANTSTRSGDDTYTWEESPTFLETIWDGGGKDTIDCANQTLSCIINLQGGSFSSIGLRQTNAEIWDGFGLPDSFSGPYNANVYTGHNNLAIAKGAVIENATGGSGNDTLIGNAAANILNGGAGDDTICGGAGKDILSGGAGKDIFVFNSAEETPLGATDRILDFTVGSDMLDFSQFDANIETGTFDRFTFIGNTAFNAAGQLRFEYMAGTQTGMLYGNINADTIADFAIELVGVVFLSVDDFIC